MKTIILSIAIIATIVCQPILGFATSVTHIGQTANAEIINNSGQKIGHATFIQGAEGVLIEIKVKHLPPGKHGMHFHEIGTCEDLDHFKMAKGHIMPSGKPHGYLNDDGGPHAGNLPNLIVHQDGSAHVELYSELISIYGYGGTPALLDSNGSTLMIHANEDDHTSQPIGGSGGRIACGVVAESDETKERLMSHCKNGFTSLTNNAILRQYIGR